jgi:hypothetical protein
VFVLGSINFESKKSGIKLKEAWDTFLIDSVQLADLTWVSKPLEKVQLSLYKNVIV